MAAAAIASIANELNITPEEVAQFVGGLGALLDEEELELYPGRNGTAQEKANKALGIQLAGGDEDLIRHLAELAVQQDRSEFRSLAILRALVPGQIAWDNAISDFNQGDYRGAAVNTLTMFGEIASAAIVTGTAPQLATGVKSQASNFAKFLCPTGPVIGRKYLGGSSIVNINSNCYFRFGWRHQESTDNQVLRIGGKLVKRLTGRDHLVLDTDTEPLGKAVIRIGFQAIP